MPNVTREQRLADAWTCEAYARDLADAPYRDELSDEQRAADDETIARMRRLAHLSRVAAELQEAITDFDTWAETVHPHGWSLAEEMQHGSVIGGLARRLLATPEEPR